MSNEINNMDDLLDDNISRSLRLLGFTFPRTAEDFERIDDLVKSENAMLPARLQDPYSFLGKKTFSHSRDSTIEQGEYFQQLAQAARDGKTISDEIKKKMAQDKLKSEKKESEE
jgi:hypothetical protein